MRLLAGMGAHTLGLRRQARVADAFQGKSPGSLAQQKEYSKMIRCNMKGLNTKSESWNTRGGIGKVHKQVHEANVELD